MKKKLVTGILLLFFALFVSPLYAEDQEPTYNPTKIKVIAKPKPSKDNIKRLPGTYISVESMVEDNFLTFVSPIWEDGMIVSISSEDGTEWTDIITEDNLTMSFVGHNPGHYTVEYMPVSSGFSYTGEFIL